MHKVRKMNERTEVLIEQYNRSKPRSKYFLISSLKIYISQKKIFMIGFKCFN